MIFDLFLLLGISLVLFGWVGWFAMQDGAGRLFAAGLAILSVLKWSWVAVGAIVLIFVALLIWSYLSPVPQPGANSRSQVAGPDWWLTLLGKRPRCRVCGVRLTGISSGEDRFERTCSDHTYYGYS